MRAAQHNPGLLGNLLVVCRPRAGRRSGDLAERVRQKKRTALADFYNRHVTAFIGDANMPERLVDGWAALGQMLGWGESTVRRRKKELLEAGVIFYRLKGRPKRRVMSFFPSVIKAWCIKKSARNALL